MLNNILKVQENWSCVTKFVRFLIQGTLFHNLRNNCVNDQQI